MLEFEAQPWLLLVRSTEEVSLAPAPHPQVQKK
jgi:hypothetical protein